MIFVGNDVVDLGDPRTEGRAADARFLDRVFDARERASIRAATDADLELWTRWAAKEAGFKVVSKLLGAPPPFVHRAFAVAWSESRDDDPSPGQPVRKGRVTYEGFRVAVDVTLCPGGVHAVARGAPGSEPRGVRLHPRVARLEAPNSTWAGSLEELRKRFSDRELDAVYSRQSAAVRLGARADLARALGVAEDRLEIVCDPGPTSRRPPRVVLDGALAEADVSLSHDGSWIAWVFWMPTDTEEGTA